MSILLKTERNGKMCLHRPPRVGTVVKQSDSSRSNTSAILHRQFIGDPFDQYLASIGLVKKAMPNDNGSSIYRAVCESLSKNQSEHAFLQEFVEDELLFQYRLQRIRSGLPNVNKIEDTLQTLSRLFRAELHVYRAIGRRPVVYNEIFDGEQPAGKVMLCEFIRGHFHLVITREDHFNLAYAQTYVYNLLYTHVFGFSRDVIKNCVKRVREDMDTIDVDVQTPLTASSQYQQNGALFCSSADFESSRRTFSSTWRPPMPYCALKSLDPSIYRNISHDLFLRERKRELLEADAFRPGTSVFLVENGLLIDATVLSAPERSSRIIAANGQTRKVHLSNLKSLFSESTYRSADCAVAKQESINDFAVAKEENVNALAINADHLHAPESGFSVVVPLCFEYNYIERISFQYCHFIMPNDLSSNRDSAVNAMQLYAPLRTSSEGSVFVPPLQFPVYCHQNYSGFTDASTSYHYGENILFLPVYLANAWWICTAVYDRNWNAGDYSNLGLPSSQTTQDFEMEE